MSKKITQKKNSLKTLTGTFLRRMTTWLTHTQHSSHTISHQGNENQYPDQTPPLPSRMAASTKTDNMDIAEDTEKLNPHTMLIGAETYGITTWGKLAWEITKVKHDPATPLLDTYALKMKPHAHQKTHRRMCMAALFTTALNENKP